MQKANEFLTDMLISKFANTLGGFDARVTWWNIKWFEKEWAIEKRCIRLSRKN